METMKKFFWKLLIMSIVTPKEYESKIGFDELLDLKCIVGIKTIITWKATYDLDSTLLDLDIELIVHDYWIWIFWIVHDYWIWITLCMRFWRRKQNWGFGVLVRFRIKKKYKKSENNSKYTTPWSLKDSRRLMETLKYLSKQLWFTHNDYTIQQSLLLIVIPTYFHSDQ